MKDFTHDQRFVLMRQLNRRLLGTSDPAITLQHELGKALLPPASGRLLIPTIYDFVSAVEIDTTHKKGLRGSIERNLYFLGTYEAGTINMIERLLHASAGSGSFIDIGAHNGLMSLFAASIGTPHIYAFEPNPAMFTLMETAIHYNKFTTVSTFSSALGDKSQTVAMTRTHENSGGTHIAHHTASDIQDVQMATLDEMMSQHVLVPPSLILIDVEGYEIHVLKGAEKTIRQHHPDLIVEYNPRQQDQQVLEFLKHHHYEIFILEQSRHIVSKLIPFIPNKHTQQMDNLFCLQPMRLKDCRAFIT